MVDDRRLVDAQFESIVRHCSQNGELCTVRLPCEALDVGSLDIAFKIVVAVPLPIEAVRLVSQGFFLEHGHRSQIRAFYEDDSPCCCEAGTDFGNPLIPDVQYHAPKFVWILRMDIFHVKRIVEGVATANQSDVPRREGVVVFHGLCAPRHLALRLANA